MTVERDSFLLIDGLSNQSRLLVYGLFPEGEKKTEMLTEERWTGSESKGNKGKGVEQM